MGKKILTESIECRLLPVHSHRSSFLYESVLGSIRRMTTFSWPPSKDIKKNWIFFFFAFLHSFICFSWATLCLSTRCLHPPCGWFAGLSEQRCRVWSLCESLSHSAARSRCTKEAERGSAVHWTSQHCHCVTEQSVAEIVNASRYTACTNSSIGYRPQEPPGGIFFFWQPQVVCRVQWK